MVATTRIIADRHCFLPNPSRARYARHLFYRTDPIEAATSGVLSAMCGLALALSSAPGSTVGSIPAIKWTVGGISRGAPAVTFLGEPYR